MGVFDAVQSAFTPMHVRAAQQADQWFPGLTRFAPEVATQDMPNIPHVAGMYDQDSGKVLINTAANQALSQDQMAGLIALERGRGMLFSPLGDQFLSNVDLTSDQRSFWDSYYLPPSVNAPKDQGERDKILKATMLSRMLVGDTLPQGSPELTDQQKQVGSLLKSYARRK